MDQKRAHKVLVILFVLLFFGFGMFLTLVSIMHAGCMSPCCAPCRILAAFQENLQFSGMFGFAVLSLSILTLSRIIVGELFRKQYASDLVTLKARLNN